MTPRLPKKDPNAERESERYARPIPSREFILSLLAEQGAPMTQAEIAVALELTEEQDLIALQRRLGAMEREGQVIRNRRNGYGLVDKMDLVPGRVIGHHEGYGFLVPDEGGSDLFLSAWEMRAVLHGDRVVARVSGIDGRGRREGSIVEVLERANHQIVGHYYIEGGIGFVMPDNRRISQEIMVPSEHQQGARQGQIVVVEIKEHPTRHRQPIGRVVEILGDRLAPGMEIEIAIRAHELPERWPDTVLAEVEHLHEEVAEADKAGREDIRQLPLVTIDGADARDFDDAVYCERHGKGWRLLVAIADVAHYVRPGTALETEGQTRGNSVYFPGRVIPMLPEVLSNGLCSLNPDVDRLCLVCELFVTPNGTVRRFRFFDGVMRSHARLTYDKVWSMVRPEPDEAMRARYEPLVPHVEELYQLFQAFKAQREKRGAIEFETAETRIEFGVGRKIERIVPTERNDAHRIIEECMIAANVAAAEFLLEHKIPALYRVHQGPTEDKLNDLRDFLAEVGLQLGGGKDPQPKHYAKLLAAVQERDDRHLIQTVLLRSLSQAIYSPDNLGHFGLAYEAYGHYTSPIRRFPDLIVHRAIRHVLRRGGAEGFAYSHSDMLGYGDHCSMTERRADEAVRDATDWLKCEYMLDKVGQEYDGIVTGVTGFGLFVELRDVYVEGLVHVTALRNDYYHFDASKHRLIGERTSVIYRLADPIRVKVARVDLDQRKIDFELAEAVGREKPRERPRRRRR